MSNSQTQYTLDQLRENVANAYDALNEAERAESAARREATNCRNRLADWQKLFDAKVAEQRKTFSTPNGHWDNAAKVKA